ncbi:cra-1, partial [Pristionchus pacificus]
QFQLEEGTAGVGQSAEEAPEHADRKGPSCARAHPSRETDGGRADSGGRPGGDGGVRRGDAPGVRPLLQGAEPARAHLLHLREGCGQGKADENLMSHLFMSYARVCNFKDQQKTALALYRLQPSQPYYLWAVMSVVMQATENPDMGAKMLLPLAQKMLTKVHDENKKEWKNAQEVELTVLVLEKQGRQAEAADLLDSDAAALLTHSSAMLMIRVLQLRVAAKQWQTVLERSEEALGRVEGVDQWLLWTYLFDAAFALADECSDEEEKQKLIDRAFSVVTQACEMAPGYRGPYMAHFEFVARTERAGVYKADKYGDAVALILAYARRFHSRPSCFVDLVKWLHVAKDRQDEVESGISAIVDEVMRKALQTAPKGDDDTDCPTRNLGECWAIVLQERVRRWYGRETAAGPTERRSRVLRLARAQLHTSSVQQPSAAMAALTAEGLYLSYRRDGDTRSLYEALLILETASRNWPEDHLSRLVLMHIYSLLGVPGRMRQLSEQLDIKMVQRDSLGHLGFHAAEFGGQVHFCTIHYTSLGDFYDLADREISECLVAAYKNGAFTQIEGVAGMRRKMRKSIMATAADVANRWISAAFSLKVVEHVVTIMKGDEEPAEWDSLSDNRDYTIFPAADQAGADEAKEYAAWAREEMIDLSRTRHLIMRVSANVAKGSLEAGRGLFANLSEQLAHCRKTYTEEQAPLPSLVNTPPSFLGEWVHGPFLVPLLRLLECSLDAIEADGDERKEAERLPSESEMSALLGELVARVRSAIDTPLPTTNTVLQMSTVMRLSSRAAQSLAFCRQLLKIMALRLVGGAPEKGASKKTVKESLSALSDATRRAADALGEQMERAKDKLENNLDECFPAVDEAFWNVEWAALLLSEKKEVDVGIGRSQIAAIEELQACLKS